jgi:hypothetical protein
MTEPPPTPAEPPTDQRRGSRRWIIGGVAAILLIVATAGTVFAVAHARADNDEARIRRLVADFAWATDRTDQAQIIRLLCAEEAQELKDSDGYDPSNDGRYDPSATRVPVTTGDIRVSGDTAQARISRPNQEPVTLHFRKEHGSWTVCAPAGDTADPDPSTS